jgi:hypothetical protein
MMEERDEDEASTCPYLTPKVSWPRAAPSFPVYCRLPNGRVRVPLPDQLMVLCTAGHYHDCPGSRRWKRRSASS